MSAELAIVFTAEASVEMLD